MLFEKMIDLRKRGSIAAQVAAFRDNASIVVENLQETTYFAVTDLPSGLAAVTTGIKFIH